MDRLGSILAAGVVTLLSASAGTFGEATELRVTRVALFSSGVGFFECDAVVEGTATAELKFRTDQINDILKSLVVEDLDGGKVGTVGYASRDPIEKTLKSFGVDLTGKPTLGALFDQLRGEPVEIAGPRVLRGVIVGVEKHKIPVDKSVIEIDLLNVLTDAGLEQVRVSELQGVKLTSEKVNAELRKALATLAASHDADRKSVSISFEGQGKRRVRASYLLEAPIWKTSYRLVLGSEKKPFLQGWATVENATEDDWRDARLSLVSGRPISFTMDLYAPLYVPRPHEVLELYASLQSPELEAGFAGREALARGVPASPAATASPAAAEPAGDAAKGAKVGERIVALGRRVAGERGRQAPARRYGGYGGGGGMMGGMDAGAEAGLAFGESVASVAEAREAGELFEYVIQAPVSIARQRSAMLPIVNEEVAGEKVSIFNPATHPKHPLNGFRVENTTSLNLMQGPVTVFDADTYAGDAKLPDLKPGEKRLIAYALDLAVEVMVEEKPQPDELVSLRIAKGTLLHRHKLVDVRTYTLKNKDKKDRNVLIEQPYEEGWTLVEPKEPAERTPSMLRFQVAAPAGKTVTQTVRLERVNEESAALTDAGLDAIGLFLRSRVISPQVRQAIEKVVAMRTERDQATRERARREKEVEEVVKEQGRIRENLKTLQQTTDVYQRQLKKFDAFETQIEELRGKVAECRAAEEAKRTALEAYLTELTVD